MFGRRGREDAIQQRAAALGGRRAPLASQPPRPRDPPRDFARLPSVETAHNASEVSAITLEAARTLLQPIIEAKLDSAAAQRRPRAEVAAEIEAIAGAALAERHLALEPLDQRQLVTHLFNGVVDAGKREGRGADKPSTVASRASIE
jgi:hypothetical protein